MKKLSMGLSVLIMMLFIFIPVTANDGIDISDDFIEVELDELKGAATIEKNGTTLALTIGSDVMYKNGEEIKLGVPVSIKYAGNVFVPLRPIVEALGCDVQWNEDLQRVDITTK